MITAVLVAFGTMALVMLAGVDKSRTGRFLRIFRLSIGIYLTLLMSVLISGCSLFGGKNRVDVVYGPPEYFGNGHHATTPDSLNRPAIPQEPEVPVDPDICYGPPSSFE